MEGFGMTWWAWVLLGLVFLMMEVMTPGGFYLLFFGFGALVVGALASAGLGGPLWAQVLLFSVASVAGLLLLRRRLLDRFRSGTPAQPVDSLVLETAVALDEIAVDQIGKVELRGTSWSARNVGDQPVARGQRCRVEHVDGLTLWVRGR